VALVLWAYSKGNQDKGKSAINIKKIDWRIVIIFNQEWRFPWWNFE
jgi:hypothetical protein